MDSLILLKSYPNAAVIAKHKQEHRLITNNFRDQLSRVPALNDALDMITAKTTALWTVQHKPDGSHAAITCDSLSSTGAVSGSTGTFTGDVVAQNGTGHESGIGTLTTVNGAPGPAASPDLVRWGLLLGGVANGHFIDNTGYTTPFIGAGSELRFWSMGFNNVGGSPVAPVMRLGVFGGVATLEDGGTGSLGLNITLNQQAGSGGLMTAAKFYRFDYSGAQGEWTAYSFSAGDFTGSGSMTWTVTSGEVTTAEYTLIGKTLLVNFSFDATTVGGTPDVLLQWKIPGGYVSNKEVTIPVFLNDNGTQAIGFAFIAAGATLIQFKKVGGPNWNAATTNTYVRGHLAFEIQ
jgi:hypothetical protein